MLLHSPKILMFYSRDNPIPCESPGPREGPPQPRLPLGGAALGRGALAKGELREDQRRGLLQRLRPVNRFNMRRKEAQVSDLFMSKWTSLREGARHPVGSEQGAWRPEALVTTTPATGSVCSWAPDHSLASCPPPTLQPGHGRPWPCEPSLPSCCYWSRSSSSAQGPLERCQQSARCFKPPG